jgi:hypothetical protein
LLHPLMLPSYKKVINLAARDIGKKMLSGTGAYVAATKTLTVTTMSTSFLATDTERKVIMSYGTAIYECFIDSWVSSTEIVVRGNLLPAVDTLMDDVRIPSNEVENDKVLLGSTRINRLLSPVHFVLESSVTNYVEAVTLEDFRVFDPAANESLDKIVFTFEGSSLLLNKGNNVSSYGALKLHAMMMPTPVSSDAMTIDLPDGQPLQLGITVLRSRILARMGKQVADSQAIGAMVQSIYQSAGQEISVEEIANKARALMS